MDIGVAPIGFEMLSDSYSLLGVGGAMLLNIILGLFVFSQDRQARSSYYFFLLTAVTTSWGMSLFLLRSGYIPTYKLAWFCAQFAFASAALIPLAFYAFVSTFKATQEIVSKRTNQIILFVTFCIETMIFSPLFLRDLNVAADGTPLMSILPASHIAFGLYLCVAFGMLYRFLWIRYRDEADAQTKLQLLYIFVGTGVPVVAGVFSNLILPLMGVSGMNWFGPFAVLFSTFTMTYGMFKHRLFDIRVVSAELLVLFMALLSTLAAVTNETVEGKIFGLVLTIVLIASGAFFILSVAKEVRTRELAEQLAKELESANAQLAALSAQKSEFLSIATHQLRTPLGAMNGYTSLILGGSFGPITEKTQEVLRKVLQSGMLMNGTIEDFLSVSRIEQGRMVYDMTDFDIRTLAKEVYEELRAGAERKGLVLHYEMPEEAFMVRADYGKLKHVISNLVDNSIKYTREGSVTIRAQRVDSSVRVLITDTGVGIPADEIGKLFDKFVRARGAAGVNVSGTGLGLYVAKQMIEAHKGKVWAESAGEGKGSTFIAEIPLVIPQ